MTCGQRVSKLQRSQQAPAETMTSSSCGKWQETHPDQSVLGLELLGGVEVVVDEPEACRFAAAELQKHHEAKSVHGGHLCHLPLNLA